MSVMLQARYFKWYLTGFHKDVFGCSAPEYIPPVGYIVYT